MANSFLNTKLVDGLKLPVDKVNYDHDILFNCSGTEYNDPNVVSNKNGKVEYGKNPKTY